jgi:hypothetical protein
VLPSLKTAKKWFLQNAEPDLLFMDIQLSDGVSFELFEHFRPRLPGHFYHRLRRIRHPCLQGQRY